MDSPIMHIATDDKKKSKNPSYEVIICLFIG